jgi:hypothetical protein
MITHRKIAALIAGLFILGVFLQSCEKVQLEYKVQGTMSYAKDIQPIFTNICISCHNGSRKPDLRTGNSYLSLKNMGDIIPNDTVPSKSKLYTKLAGGHNATITPLEIEKIRSWVAQGTLNN